MEREENVALSAAALVRKGGMTPELKSFVVCMGLLSEELVLYTKVRSLTRCEKQLRANMRWPLQRSQTESKTCRTRFMVTRQVWWCQLPHSLHTKLLS